MTDFEHILDLADQLFDEKKFLHAIQLYNSLLRNPKTERRALIKLIEIYDIQDQPDSAIKLFEDYLEKAPEDDNVRTFYGQFLIRNNKYSEAHQALSAVSTKSHPEKNFLIGLANFYLQDYRIASLNFIDFISLNKSSDLLPEAYLYLAKCHMHLAELEKALDYCSKSGHISGKNYDVYKTEALIYYQKEMYFHALDKLNSAVKLFPSDLSLYEWQGRIFIKLGEYKKAKKVLEFYSENSEPSTEIFALLGLVLQNLKQYKAANDYYHSALKLNPKNEIALQGRMECESISK